MTLFNAFKNRLIIATSNEGSIKLSIGTPNGKFIEKTIKESEWPAYLNDKLNSGYTEIETEVKKKKLDIHPELQKLIDISRQIVENNYKFNVTPSKAAIEEAKQILFALAKTQDLSNFNEGLFSLFSKIPRKMKNPILFTAKDEDDFNSILERENDLLENLNSYEETNDNLDFSFEECTDEKEIKKVKELLGHTVGNRFVAAYKVKNPEVDKRFEEYCVREKIVKTSLLKHGSKNQNWYSIMKKGLMVNPVNVIITGKMFGTGEYFANDAPKALGYTSVADAKWTNECAGCGYMGIFEVATGNEYKTDMWQTKHSNLDEESFKRNYPGYDSFHALKGTYLRNDEIIVYNSNASRMKFLVKIK